MREILFYLADWAIITVSFFNTILMLWLGLTVLLNAERRQWGTWIAGGAFLLAGLFFVGHSAVVGRAIGTFNAEREFWWRIGWLPFIGGPYLWYTVIAWYTGVLQTRHHRFWLGLVSLLGGTAVGLLLFANPLPSFDAMFQQSAGTILSVGSIPAVIMIYPVYSTLCIILALLALRHPVASDRFMGDIGRKRAHPWLTGASLALLCVSLSVGAAAAWFLHQVQIGQLPRLSLQSLALIINFDLFISGLIALTVILVGRAIVSYEIFTGKALPRGGLARNWQQILILAAGYSTLVGLGLSALVTIHPIYQLLLATVLMTTFVAVANWRAYVHHERSMERLRPFVASQKLYERLLRPTMPADVDIAGPFIALCGDVLGARVAYLAAQGPLAPLVGPGLAYPDFDGQAGSRMPPLSVMTELSAAFRRAPQQMCVALDPARYGGAVWAVPLWSERGLIGLLLLGEKRDGGIYTQEEIEIARATGERLIDTQASAEMSRKLMAAQRQRLAESQVIDRHTRRMLHDEVLPDLHMVMLTLSSAATDTSSATVTQLAEIHRKIANLLHSMPAAVVPEVARLGLIGALRETVAHELGRAFDGITWQIEPEAEQAARRVPTLTAEVIFFAAREVIRNAARYGRNSDAGRALHLTIAARWRDGLELIVEDDGVGMGAAGPAAGSSGQGLALHSTMMAVIGGTLTTDSVPGEYTRIALTLPQGAWDILAG